MLAVSAAVCSYWTPLRPSLEAVPRHVAMVVREWRLFGVEVPLAELEGQAEQYNSELTVTEPLRLAVARRLSLAEDRLSTSSMKLVRKSLDARKKRSRARSGQSAAHDVCWSHVVDVQLSRDEARRLKPQLGRLVPTAPERVPAAEPRVRGVGAPRHVVVIGAGLLIC